MDSLTENWHVVAIDLKFNCYYVLFEDRTRSDCEELVQDWNNQKLSDVIPVIWPANKTLPTSLFAA